MNLSRRLFLIGSASAIAAAAIPSAIALPAQRTFIKRRFWALTFATSSQAGTLKLFGHNTHMESWTLGPKTNCRWRADPIWQLSITPDELIRLEFDPIGETIANDPVHVCLDVVDTDDLGKEWERIEVHQFPSVSPPVLMRHGKGHLVYRERKAAGAIRI